MESTAVITFVCYFDLRSIIQPLESYLRETQETLYNFKRIFCSCRTQFYISLDDTK